MLPRQQGSAGKHRSLSPECLILPGEDLAAGPLWLWELARPGGQLLAYQAILVCCHEETD